MSTKANGKSNWTSSFNAGDSLLGSLLVIDYRYAKFVLDPNNERFSALTCVSHHGVGRLNSDTAGSGTGQTKGGQAWVLLRMGWKDLLDTNTHLVRGPMSLKLKEDQSSLCC